MTNVLERQAPARLLRWEPGIVWLAVWLAFVAIPLSLGGLGLASDALNHHIYLGWSAERSRLDLDYLAAGYQSYQFPYLYWPVYKMAVLGWSGAATGAVLASLQALAAPAVWMLARACIPGSTVYDLALRWLGVVLAFLSSVALSMLDSSQDDLMAAVPLVWAVALAMEPVARHAISPARARRCVLLSGLCAGLSVAAKLSNGPLAVLLPALWLLASDTLAGRMRAALLGCLATAVGFLLAYGYWGYGLWQHFGNPIYPFYDGLFAPLRALLGAR